MMRAGKFSSSLVFAAVSGLAAVPYLLVALPGLGFIRTFALGSIVSVAAYIVVVSPSLVRGLRYGALTLVLGVGLYALAPKVVVLFASATLGAGDERLSALGGLDSETAIQERSL